MSDTTKAQVVSALRKFTHASRTNLEKRTLTNHDAIAFMLWKLGALKVREIQDLVSEWRFGTAARKPVVVERFDYRRDKHVKRTEHHAPIGLLHMFNTCSSGGYSFVADRPDQRGHVMCASGGKYMYRCDDMKEHQIAAANKKEAEKGKGDERDCYFFRRTYWYRAGKGLYAPTLECAKRMAEIGHALK